MKRWHLEEHIMRRRMKQEQQKHGFLDPSGEAFKDCHCSKGIGLMRKRRPYDSCKCWMCELPRQEAKRSNRRIRRAARREINKQMGYAA